jgi:hypothetical protein
MPEHLPMQTSSAVAGLEDNADEDVSAAVRRWAEQNVGISECAGRLYERLIAVVEPPLLTTAM